MGKLADAIKKSNNSEKNKKVDAQVNDFQLPQKDKADDKASNNIFSEDDSRNQVDFRLVVYHQPESLAAEHFKVLRAKIVNASSGKKIKSVLITSALEQEGKTMVSCNLAVSIAQSIDPWVLLIDGDIRRPSVHRMLGLKKAYGLTDYLRTGNALSHYLTRGILDKMTVLQAGSAVRNPAELMTSEKMKMLLDEVKKRYDDRFVVIDSPPANLAAETLVLAEEVDAVVLVIRYGVTDRNAVEEAIHKIGKDKILGFVFNGFEVTPRKYTYYKKKYYYSSYN